MKKIWLVVLLISLGFLLGSCKHQKEHLTFEMSELGQAVMYEVNIRCYTEAGTFLAFKEHLPRLKELG
ncbi:MAG TPA: alpha-amylase, partial [Bacilli bacterium]|nr:alpha-amylase [Bacilli bacterium]